MKDYIKNNKKLLLNALLSIIVIVLVLTIILNVYANQESKLEKFNNTILATIEKAREVNIEKEYVLIEFPDKEEIISKNGKIKKADKRYKEFTSGYFIIYKDGSYAFKLSNGSYCATKDYNDTDINVDTYEDCISYVII